MPVRPSFEWEQTHEDVFLHITIKGFKKDAVDVFVSDLFTKVNAAPTYLLALDLLHPVSPDDSTHYFDGEDPSLLHVKLRKAEAGLVWDALCVNAKSVGKQTLLARRAESMRRAEAHYNKKLEARGRQREVERRRMTDEQWDVEKQQRAVIEQRFCTEKDAAEAELYAWEEHQKAEGTEIKLAAAAAPQSPADILAGVSAAGDSSKKDGAQGSSAATVAPVRETSTVNVTIDFTPKLFAMPTRSRGDEEYYRQSRYKPVSVEDSPMFWKERADAFYKSRDWRAAANAYSESIKRDGVFLTCVMNRSACHLHLAEFKKAIEDCTLSLTMLANTPASEITQERYRALMTKLHARRGTAYCWNEELAKGHADLKMACAYRDPTSDEDVVADTAVVEKLMIERGLLGPDGQSSSGAVSEEDQRLAAAMLEASALYFKNKHEAAIALYRTVLETNPYHTQARSNLAAALLQQGEFKEALKECEKVIAFCAEVAEALTQPGALASNEVDSDDDEEGEGSQSTQQQLGVSEGGEEEGEEGEEGNRDEMTRRRRAAARKISESSGHVYLLLKAYVRSAAALCGLKDYHGAHSYLERALRITPYDNDLMDDCNRLTEKVRVETLVAASTAAKA